MARHIWSVLCYKGVLDKYTNNVSLLDVIEELTITSSKPMPQDAKGFSVPAHLSLVSLWTRSDPDVPENARIRISVLGPSGSRIGGGESAVDLTAHRRSRLFSNIESLSFHGTGLYQFIVEQYEGEDKPWSEVARIPLEVKLAEPKATPAQPPLEPVPQPT